MKFINRIAVALLIASLASVAAFAKTKSEKVTFIDDIKVNGTLVKKGSYDLKFDDKTGEVTISKNGKVVARANSSMEQRSAKARRFELRYTGRGCKRRIDPRDVPRRRSEHRAQQRSRQPVIQATSRPACKKFSSAAPGLRFGSGSFFMGQYHLR